MVKNKLNIIIFSFILFFISCSELEKEAIPTEPNITTHEVGFSSPAKHGSFIRENKWDISLCKNCHGAKFDGGSSGISCITCHPKSSGPENCTTCHGSVNSAPPEDLSKNWDKTSRGVGAHQIHILETAQSLKVECAMCHKVPSSLNSVNHLGDDLKAEIIFDQSSRFFTSNSSYNFSDGSCSNTYCHGNFNNGNTLNKISWTSDPSATACGTCHGDKTKNTIGEKSLPKIDSQGGFHPNDTNCFNCHDSVIDQNFIIIAPQKHINGINDFKK